MRAAASSVYESDEYLADYLLFHYGQPGEICPFDFAPAGASGFHERLAREMVGALPKSSDGAPTRALDLGCAVGRLTFELSGLVDEAIGIDSSTRFIMAARHIAENHSIQLGLRDEGEILEYKKFQLPAPFRQRKVRFEVGNAEALSPELGTFDVVVLSNLLDHLGHPMECLRMLPRLVRAGGRLVISSPNTWRDEYTSKKNWLGGSVRRGVPIRTLDRLRTELESHFELLDRKDLPFLIREHRRKYEWIVAEVTAWRRKSPVRPAG
ncbi:MAG: putative 4-mercaptohistidine N1-methyltransferase [Verrucomicrobiae bacterium]|nr:putative 4-mercaptohistidine N1-methyltransferase [Verrucomicrobiae bacterium]